jgi:hypothetical protein
VHNDGSLGSLTRHDLTGRNGKKHTRAESHEEGGGHEEIVLSKNDTHSLRDERVYKEEDKTVEEHGKAVGAHVLKRNLSTICLEDHTWAERKEKNSGNSYLLRGNKRKHLIYTHNIFSIVDEVIKRSTT